LIVYLANTSLVTILQCTLYREACFLHLLNTTFFFLTERLIAGISQIKQVLAAKFTTENHENQEDLTKHIDKIVKTATSK
jgi:hypothetical protein